MTVGAVFVEPFFTRPQDAIANAVGGIGAFASADRAQVENLWGAYLVLMILLLLAGVGSALLGRPGRLKWVSNRVSTTLGRAVIVGGVALSLEVVGRAARAAGDFEYLGFGTAALLLALAIDWSRVLSVVRGDSALAQTPVAEVIGPSALLLQHPRHLIEGASIWLSQDQAHGRRTLGWVARKLAHADGARYEVVLADRWDSLIKAPGDTVRLTTDDDGTPVIGAVLQGSDDAGIRFRPAVQISVGHPVSVEVDGRAIYQVTSVGIAQRSWSGSASLVFEVNARYVGRPQGSHLVGRPIVPRPHSLVEEVNLDSVAIPDGYCRLGSLKGTAFPIGLDLQAVRRSHVAILGMSGTGKTSVAHRLAGALGEASTVVAVDVTGEYTARLGCAAWDDANMTTTGFWVWEPQGEPTKRAREMVEKVMTAGSSEYQSGAEPARRVLFFEEAHALIPEWNFAARHQQADINFTTRMIMQARKLGLMFVIVSQRTAVVSKSALSQCENYIVLRTIDETSLSYLEAIVGPEFRSAVAHLERYEALCVGPEFNADGPVIVSLDPPRA